MDSRMKIYTEIKWANMLLGAKAVKDWTSQQIRALYESSFDKFHPSVKTLLSYALTAEDIYLLLKLEIRINKWPAAGKFV